MKIYYVYMEDPEFPPRIAWFFDESKANQLAEELNAVIPLDIEICRQRQAALEPRLASQWEFRTPEEDAKQWAKEARWRKKLELEMPLKGSAWYEKYNIDIREWTEGFDDGTYVKVHYIETEDEPQGETSGDLNFNWLDH